MKILEPHLIAGVRFVDDRGILKAVKIPENFTVQRFYTVKNWTSGFVRAWHGHENESKLIYVSAGAGLIGVAKMLDRSIAKSSPQKYVLDAESDKALLIPSGYANGLMSLTVDCEFTILSNATLEQSQNDDFRFPPNELDIWNVEFR